ncbi:jg1759 [Pararge aegeria aegeria]|uniref:Jg1759 protein n=1 Tax=Pararge aegeria aegeria TaxID=348720 RepID=A0A8S4RR35_9NEOP|nr:jg1759 [Pararge aegeria aegeria]
MDCKLSKDFPFEVVILNTKENPEIKDYLDDDQISFARVGSKRYFFPKEFLTLAPSIYNMALRSDDTFVVTFPKSGTTMTQELVWIVCNNSDYENAKSTALSTRFPFLELPSMVRKVPCTENGIEILKKLIVPLTIKEVEEMPSPRFIKSHLPLSLLPPSLLDKTKVVYVARDPRDVAVSYYYHDKLLNLTKPENDFKHYWKYFVSDNISFGPYFEHVLEAWKKRNHPNMLFLFYEEITKDLPRSIQRVANFFGKTISDDQVNKLADHMDFDNFKKNKSVNKESLQDIGIFRSDGAFIRKGKSGGWRDYFDAVMSAQADEWIAKNLQGTDFRFPHC